MLRIIKQKTGVISTLVVSACVTGVSLFACGSDTSSGFACDEQVAGAHMCTSYSNLSSTEQSDLQAACTAGGGTIASNCPASGLVGCCELTQDGVAQKECYFSGTASELKTVCSAEGGTWTGSSSGSGGSSSKSSSSKS